MHAGAVTEAPETARRRIRPGAVVAAVIAVAVLVALFGALDREGSPEQGATFLERFDEVSTRLAAAEAEAADEAPGRAFQHLDAALGRAVDGYADLEPPGLLRDDVALMLEALRAEQAATAAVAAGDTASSADLLDRRSKARNLQSAVRRSAEALVDVER